MNPSLKARLVEARPSAVYLGTVYTQTVVLEIDGVPTFDVYDPDVLVSPDLVGTEQAVEIVAFCAVVRTSPAQEKRIAVNNEERPVFRGVVRSIDDAGNGVLDVGVGTIRFRPDEADERLDVGSWVQITRAAIHLTDFEGWVSYEDRYDQFAEQLQSGTVKERCDAARFFGMRATEDCLDVLVDALHHDDETGVRCEVATTLGRLGMAARPPCEERDPRIEHELRQALEANDDAVVEAARLALEDIKLAERDHMHSRDW